MTQDDYDALKEFLKGVMFVGVLVLLALAIANWGEDGTPEKKFEVVDQYKGCDIVRYTDPSTRWHYFLDCES